MFGRKTKRETLVCPRRDEAPPHFLERLPATDKWANGKCSYCGSLQPRTFLDRLKAGEVLGTTTKNYKAYLGQSHDKFYYKHLSTDEREEFIQLYNDGEIEVDFLEYFIPPFFAAEDPSGKPRG